MKKLICVLQLKLKLIKVTEVLVDAVNEGFHEYKKIFSVFTNQLLAIKHNNICWHIITGF